MDVDDSKSEDKSDLTAEQKAKEMAESSESKVVSIIIKLMI